MNNNQNIKHLVKKIFRAERKKAQTSATNVFFCKFHIEKKVQKCVPKKIMKIINWVKENKYKNKLTCFTLLAIEVVVLVIGS